MPAIFCVRFSAMAGMDLGNEKQMSTTVTTKVILHFSDLASAEKSVNKRTQFFSDCKTGTRSSKFVFYAITNKTTTSSNNNTTYYPQFNICRQIKKSEHRKKQPSNPFNLSGDAQKSY